MLATNVFPSLLRRNRLHTVPVYDYVLGTQPLTPEQLDSISWQGRQGISDTANQFHYYRLSADSRILWGGYDAAYYYGRKVDPNREDRPSSFRKIARHFFITFPQLSDVRFSHRWSGPIDTNTRFCAHRGPGRPRPDPTSTGSPVWASAPRGLPPTSAWTSLTDSPPSGPNWRWCDANRCRSHPSPLASAGIQATRWSLDRADHHGGRRNLLLRTLDRMGLGFDS